MGGEPSFPGARCSRAVASMCLGAVPASPCVPGQLGCAAQLRDVRPAATPLTNTVCQPASLPCPPLGEGAAAACWGVAAEFQRKTGHLELAA